MITRQDVYRDLFKLKNAGEDISSPLKVMESCKGVPQEVVEFLQDRSPQFQFYHDLHKNQKALMKNILKYESFDTNGKIKLCSSLLTRAMIAVEYKNLDESLLEDLQLSKISRALDKALSNKDPSKLDEVLEGHRNAIRLFLRRGESSHDQDSIS